MTLWRTTAWRGKDKEEGHQKLGSQLVEECQAGMNPEPIRLRLPSYLKQGFQSLKKYKIK